MKKLTAVLDQNCLMALENVSDYINSVTLSANNAKSFNKPQHVSKIQFSSDFTAGQTLTFGGTTLTAVTSGATGNQFNIGGTLATTLANIQAKLASVAASYGTWAVTDANTSITLTSSVTTPQVLPASTNKPDGVITLTPGARFVRLSAGALFYYAEDRAAVISAADITNGTASVSVPATVQPFFCVDDVGYISVIAPQDCVVSAEWWA